MQIFFGRHRVLASIGRPVGVSYSVIRPDLLDSGDGFGLFLTGDLDVAGQLFGVQPSDLVT